ncbi:MAG: HAD family phosphatase [Lachnospiraceae bacterium]|nr:HAD family phosphatase [Lachnospiraceae bacterium]
MMTNDFCAAIFDLDGTLVDSMWIWKAIDIDYLGRHGIPYDETLQDKINGLTFYETAVFFKENYGIRDSTDEIQQEWNDMAIEYYRTKVFPKPGAIEYLKQLRRRGVKTGIATSNSGELLSAVLTSTGLAEYMDSIHTANEIKKGKPAPDIFLLVAEDLGVDPADCMVFEDIIPGIQAGHNAGMRVCSVYDEYSVERQEEIIAMSDYHIRSFTELLEPSR